MNLWESSPTDGFIKVDDAWVRTSRVESVSVDPKRWGTTGAGKDLFKVSVRLIGGATFSHLTTDTERFVKAIIGDPS